MSTKNHPYGFMADYATGQGFVYYEHLKENRGHFWRGVGARAEKDLKNMLSQISNQFQKKDLTTIGNNLITLGNIEMQNELALLKKYFDYRGGPISFEDYPIFIKDINTLVGLRGEFENHLKVLEKKMNGKSRAPTAASFYSSNYATILSKKISSIFSNPQILNDFINGNYDSFRKAVNDAAIKTIEDAVIKTSKQTDKITKTQNGQEVEEEVQIWQSISKLISSINFPGFQDMIYKRFNLEGIADKLINWKNEQIKNNKTTNRGLSSKIRGVIGGSEQVTRSVAGFIEEYFVGLDIAGEMSEVGTKVLVSNKITTDSITVYAKNMEIDLDEILKQTDTISENSLKEAREKLQAFSSDFLSKLDTNFIQYNNIKNYGLGDSFNSRGFKTKRGASELRNLFGRLGINPDNLLEVLYNTGSGALLSGEQSFREELKLQMAELVAYILFDDWNTIGLPNSRAIHMFDLDGVKVPLSYLLIAMGNAILSVDTNLSSVMGVHISVPRVLYTPPIDITEGTSMNYYWNEQAKHARANTQITIQFLRNFKDLIKQMLGTI